ncbi:MAG TPA: hypothetical protein VJ256_02825 [Dehalococcoidia bacterium]|nr:hypothetical protein [Dehalococcoidia bacterium]
MVSAESIRGWWDRGGGRGQAAYFAAFNMANALNYGHLVLTGFLLRGHSYGLFGALFGIVYLSGALGNAVKVMVAKVVAEANATAGDRISSSLLMAVVVKAGGAALVAALGALAAMPLLARAFDASAGPLLWVALSIGLSVLVPAFYGVQQGLQDFTGLGVTVFAGSALRLLLGGALVLAGWGVTGALAGVALGLAASGLLSLALLRGRIEPTRRPWPLKRMGQLLGMVVAASVAMSFPTSFDVAVVGHYFPPQESSLFTAVSVLGRVVLFLPLALSFIAFPKVAAARVRGESSWVVLLVTMGLVGTLSLGTALALMVMVNFTGWLPAGVDAAQAVGLLGWYLMAMVLFSLVVVLIYYNLGRSNAFYVYGVLLPYLLLQSALLVSWHHSLTTVAQVVFASNAVLLALSLGLTLAPEISLLPQRAPLATGRRPLEVD